MCLTAYRTGSEIVGVLLVVCQYALQDPVASALSQVAHLLSCSR